MIPYRGPSSNTSPSTVARDHAPPARKQSATWSSTIPVACISAYAVVGPTKTNPRRLSSLAIATESGLVAGTSARVAGRRVGRERPQEGVETLGQPLRRAGVGNGGRDLGAVAHDARVGKEPRIV